MRPELTYNEQRLHHDCSRVVTRLLSLNSESRSTRVIRRIAEMDTATAEDLLEQIIRDFGNRHRDIYRVFALHLDKVQAYVPQDVVLDATRQALVGACFTMEYSVEAAALFNPSIVAHPDQSGVDQGCMRFIMSLRATGEGHISSIAFRTGLLDGRNGFHFDPLGPFTETQNTHVNPVYDRNLFTLKLNEMDACNEITAYVLAQLPAQFTYSEMRGRLDSLTAHPVFSVTRQNESREILFWLANSNYTMDFDPVSQLSERVIFPVSENESCGIEDARFVRFVGDDGDVTYYATYTAYNGVAVLPQLIETRDFDTFRVITLNGKAICNKGMALFPRKIHGKYAMLSRQDGENNRIMFSDNLHFWQESEIIQEPSMPWEFVQVGNCGAPVELTNGWLVLTHGVGPMRRYCIGAIMLGLEDPRKVIGRLREPLIVPREEDREGYVPNVVYSCGALLHNDELVIPYAMSDTCSGMVTVDIRKLTECMEATRSQ